jgi:phage-related protein
MKPVLWVGSAKKDLEGISDTPRREIRAALFAAENGSKVGYAKPMRGDLGGVMEIVTNDRGGTFRGIYYVGEELIYALHFFKKKSKRGTATPKRDLDLISRRLAWARRHEKTDG